MSLRLLSWYQTEDRKIHIYYVHTYQVLDGNIDFVWHEKFSTKNFNKNSF